MSTHEGGYRPKSTISIITAGEYEQGYHARARADEICSMGIYKLAIRLDHPEIQAIQGLVRVLSSVKNTDTVIAELNYVDPGQFNPASVERQEVEVDGDGVLRHHTLEWVRGTSGEEFPIVQSYLRDYFEEQLANMLPSEDDAL